MNQKCRLDPERRSWGKGSRGQRFFPTFQLGKKEDSPPSTNDRSRRRLRQALDEPPNANQECAGVG